MRATLLLGAAPLAAWAAGAFESPARWLGPPREASRSAAVQEFRWKGRIAPGRAIEIKGVNGDVSAAAAGGNEVEVTAVKSARRSDAEEVKIEVVEHGDGVTICAVYPTPTRAKRPNTCAPGDEGHMSSDDNDVKVHFTVRVPAGVRFVGRTVNGDVEAASLDANVQAYTVNGSIDIATRGYAEAETVNGSITATMGRADWEESVDFETVNGGITLRLPAALDTEVRASTVNGDVSSDWPLTVKGRFGPRKVSGTIGRGGRELHLGTVNGSIRLLKS